jgi:hypothetical protein
MYRDLPSFMYGKMDECHTKMHNLSPTTRGLLELSAHKDGVYLCFLREAHLQNPTHCYLFEINALYL